MKKNLILILFPVLCMGLVPGSYSQLGTLKFQKTYGGSGNDIFYDLIDNHDGTYSVAGATSSYSTGGYDVWYVKLDVKGDVLFTKTFGGPADDVAYSIAPTDDDGFLLCGYTKSYGAGGADFLIIKIDGDGTLLWSRAIGGSADDLAMSVSEASGGTYYVGGHTQSFGSGGYDAYIIRIDESGDTLWARTCGRVNHDLAYSICTTTDGGCAFTGQYKEYSNGYNQADVFFVKMNSSGDTLWTRCLGKGYVSGDDVGYSIISTSDGGNLIAGGTYSFGLAGALDYYVIKTDVSGFPEWSRRYGGYGHDGAITTTDQMDIAATAEGGYLVLSKTTGFGVGGTDLYAVAISSTGDTLWTRTYGGSTTDLGYAVIQASDGGFLYAGYTQSYGSANRDAYLVKTDINGNSSCNESPVPSLAGIPPDLMLQSHCTALPFGQLDYPVMAVSDAEPGLTELCLTPVGYLNVKVFLEGPYVGSVMSVNLNSQGVIPVMQPYNGSPWNYYGKESVNSIPGPSVVDWILLELRETTGGPGTALPDSMLQKQAVFLLSDGQVVDLDGFTYPELYHHITSNIFMVIKHRNHVGIISSNPLPEIGGIFTYDFSSGPDQVYGSSLAHSEIAPGIWGMTGGDGNGDGEVSNPDKNDIWIAQSGSSGYKAGDFNLDVEVNNMDKGDVWAPNGGTGGQVPESCK